MNMRLSFVVALIGLSSVSFGQEASQLSDHPVFIARFNGWTQQGFADYVRALNNDLQVGSRITEAIDKQKDDIVTTTVVEPTSGVLVYMIRGLIPSAEQIQYAEVAGQDEFDSLVRLQKKQSGESSTIEGSGDKYRLSNTIVSRIEITDEPTGFEVSDEDFGIPVQQVSASTADPPDAESAGAEIPEGQQVSIMIGPLGMSSSSARSTDRTVEENGRRYRETSHTVTTYYRYHNGFMFSSNTPMLRDMNLPSAEVLRDQNDAELNGQLSFYPDRIPMGFRRLGWDLLSAGVGAELQQHDDEPAEDYAWRRAAGKAGLSLVQATMFDTQEITGWMKFGRDEEPVRGELKIAARANSGLGKKLLEISSADSRFAPILNDTAAATLHVAVNLPDDWKDAASALQMSYAAELSSTEDEASLATLDVMQSAISCSTHGTLEAILKLGWSPESGGVIYGGLQVDENPDLLNSVFRMISSNTAGEPYELIQAGEMQFLKIHLPDEEIADFLRLSHVYFAHADSCLWFVIGGENGHEIIRQSVERCRETAGRMRTPMLTADLDFDRLLAYPQDDATGLTAISRLWVKTMERVICEYAPFGTEANPSENSPDLAFRALQMGGSKQIRLTLAADESGLRLSGTLGTALLRSWMAPVVQMLDHVAAVSPSVQESTTDPDSVGHID